MCLVHVPCMTCGTCMTCGYLSTCMHGDSTLAKAGSDGLRAILMISGQSNGLREILMGYGRLHGLTLIKKTESASKKL